MGLTTDLNKLTKVPLPNNIGKIEKISCDDAHSILLNDKSEIFGCGCNK